MARCFLTGVEIDLRSAWVLNPTTARHLLADMRRQIAALERLVEQLGTRDKVEFGSPHNGRKFVRQDWRFISKTVAEALGSAYPGVSLFCSYEEWRQRGRRIWLTREQHAQEASHGNSDEAPSSAPGAQSAIAESGET